MRSEGRAPTPLNPGMPQDVVEHVSIDPDQKFGVPRRTVVRPLSSTLTRRNTTQHVTKSSVDSRQAQLSTRHRSSKPRRQIRDLLSLENTTSNEVRMYIRLALPHRAFRLARHFPWTPSQSVARPAIDRRQNRLTLPIPLIIGRHALASGSTSRKAIGPPSNRNSLKRRLC